MTHTIRTFGDPVLKTIAAEITEVDEKLVRIANEMVEIMYEAPGIAVAAPQIGVQKQLVVYAVGDGAHSIINPTIKEAGGGEWVYDEGCLSIPGLFVELIRPKEVLVHGWTLEGVEVDIEADELLARMFQHEIDHLNGVLFIDHISKLKRDRVVKKFQKMAKREA
jgi:peptide deformylase